MPQPDLPRKVHTIEHEWIPISHGIRLAARIWLPEGAEHDPVPAIMEYIPYRKRDGTRVRDDQTHPFVAGHGYAVVRVDLRGSGDSDGVLVDEYLETELRDGEEALRWIAGQPWCNGRVGVMGISWGGFNALQLAARQPPELGAIVTVASTDDRYADDVHYMGGCLLSDNLSWASTMFAYTTGPPDPALVGDAWRDRWLDRLRGSGLWLARWLEHQHRDDYWRHGSVGEDLSRIEVPVLAVSGWSDGYTNAVFRLLEGLDVPCRGLVGPWGHKYPHQGIPGPAIDFLSRMVRWWDRWLKGDENGVDDDPALVAWMQHSQPPHTSYEQREGRWVQEPVWPSPHIRPRTYRLAPPRLVPDDQPAAVPEARDLLVHSPLSVGFFSGKWCSYASAPDLPGDQREEDGGSLTFDTDRLDESLEVLGAPEVELTLTSNRPTAMIAVRLSDVRPDNTVTRVTYGLLNLTHRDGHADPAPLPVGEPVRIRIPLNHVAHAFPAGHRIRLALSTSYWPLAWLPPEPVHLTVHTEDCRLRLPVRPPRSDDEHPGFDPPVLMSPPATTQLRPEEHSWRVERDLATDTSTLVVVRDDGTVRYDDLDGLEVTSRAVERYRYSGDDVTSARGETTWERGYRRGDWDVRTHTRTVLTCTPTHFHVTAELDAFEGAVRVHSQNWDERPPRRLV